MVDISVKNLVKFFVIGENLLDGLTFEIQEGERVAILGRNGCGKTTLASLLLKFYEAPRGSLFIDGEDIREIPARAIRDACGYVPQDGFLFSAPVEDNISFYTPGCTHADVLRAAEAANIRA